MCAGIIRFTAVGVVNTVVHFAAFIAIDPVLPYAIAHLCAMATAMVGSYFLNCRYTFEVSPSMRSFLLFPLSTLVNVGLSTAGVVLAVECWSVDSRIATVLAGVVATPATFLMTKVCLVSERAGTE